MTRTTDDGDAVPTDSALFAARGTGIPGAMADSLVALLELDGTT